jgi:microsomal dipeptidase-like Zn-dependent dipeptidase
MARVTLLVLCAACLAAQAPQDRDQRLVKDILIFDAHIGTPRCFLDEGYKLAREHGYYELDIPRMKKGRMGAVMFGIYAQPRDYPPHLWWLPRSLEVLDALHREVNDNAAQMEFACTAADGERIHKSGKLAAMASLEGGHYISGKAVLDAVEANCSPFIASHSSVKAIAPIVRNMPDDVIKAVAKKGGVICINLHAGYLDKAAYDV